MDIGKSSYSSFEIMGMLGVIEDIRITILVLFLGSYDFGEIIFWRLVFLFVNYDLLFLF